MIEKPTVIILGAGASFPYGYPLGMGLIEYIYNGITGIAKPLKDQLENLNFSEKEIVDFAEELVLSQKMSIDAFLEHRPEYMDMGKISIAYSIIKGELMSKSKLIDFNNDDNWFRYFYNSLNTNFEDFEENKFSILTFNYDRSFEEFLFTALKHSYNEIDENCASIMEKIPIIHLHGKVDSLPWQSWINGRKRPYGQIVSGESLQETSKGIKIIHENFEESEPFKKAHSLLAESEEIIFLGLNLLNETNLNRLKIKSYLQKSQDNGRIMDKEIFASAYDVQIAERSRIESYFNYPIKLGYDPYTNAPYKNLPFLRNYIHFQ